MSEIERTVRLSDEASVPRELYDIVTGAYQRAVANERRRAEIAERHAYAPQQALIAELVEALEEAKLQIEYLHEKFSKTGAGMATLSKIDAALAKAKEAQP